VIKEMKTKLFVVLLSVVGLAFVGCDSGDDGGGTESATEGTESATEGTEKGMRPETNCLKAVSP
jgi:hypothetical protein